MSPVVVRGLITIFYVIYFACASVFRTEPQEINAIEGQDVVILCSVLEIGEVVLWQNGSEVLSTGQRIFLPPSSKNRVSILSDSSYMFNLQIRNVTVQDEGNYSCQVPGKKIQLNRLIINVPATIEFLPAKGNMTIVEDGEFSLVCRAKGKPQPSIKWIFHGSGGPVEMSNRANQEVLSIRDVSRSNAGLYECTADNGVGVPASRKIRIEVEFAPMLRIQKKMLYVGPGQDATIECYFSANPNVEVTWYHNDLPIKFNERGNIKRSRKVLDDYNDVSMLDINELKTADLGTYSCYGENKMGIAHDSAKLNPNPFALKIISGSKSRYMDRYTLHWNVSSHSQLLEFTIALKQLNDSYEGDWHNFSIPPSGHRQRPNHSQEYTLQKLAANATYVVRLKAKNVYGYSNWSESFMFHTGTDSSAAFDKPKSSLVFASVALLVLEYFCKNWSFN